MSDEQDPGTAPAETTTQTTATAPSGAVSVSGAADTPNTETAAGEAGKPAGTVLGTEAGDKPVAAPADWPDDWRGKLAGEDKKFLNTLERFASPADLAKAYRELQVKVSSGQLKANVGKPPEKATPEELATWRKENGIPEAPDGYKIELPNGIVPGDADKPVMAAFLERAHANNLPPEAVNTALGFYYEMVNNAAAQQAAADDAAQQNVVAGLRKEWGQDYTRNVAFAEGAFFDLPEGIDFKQVMAARLPDGSLVGDNPKFIAWAANLGRERNPQSTLTGPGAESGPHFVENRIAEITQMMHTDMKSYERNPKLQAEFQELIAVRERMQARSAA